MWGGWGVFGGGEWGSACCVLFGRRVQRLLLLLCMCASPITGGWARVIDLAVHVWLVQLLHEEVIHLQLQKKLTVCDQRSKELLPVHELWSTFSRINPAFPSRFAVYRRFRKKGWYEPCRERACTLQREALPLTSCDCYPHCVAFLRVVRCGLRAGSDFVLYRFGPDIDHAMFSLSVVPLGADGTAGRGLMDWISFQVRCQLACAVARVVPVILRHLEAKPTCRARVYVCLCVRACVCVCVYVRQGLHRVAGAIAKDVLLCYVSPQPGHTVADVSSAESAESLTVHEAVVRRRVKLDVTADMHTFAPTSMMEQRMRHGRKRGRKMQQVALPPRFEPLTSTASAPPQRPTHRGWFADEASWLASS